MIRFSALLVALAIGLLVAGVAASNLPLVYVSIAVCAGAALLLAAGVLRHWSEIFGTGAKRIEPSPFAASRPVPSPATASPASAGRTARRPAAASGLAGSTRAGPVGAPGMAGFRAGAGAAPAARGPEPTVAADRYRATQRPAESEPEPARAEPIHAAATDDLWDRVNEELESAGKRDSGRLSWPAQDFSIPSGMSLPAEPPEPETLGGPGAPRSDDLWQPAAGWQPPRTPQSSWPFAPPAEPASAVPAGRDTERDADADADAAASETVAAGPARMDETTRSARVADAPSQAEADRDRGPAARDEAAQRGQAAERDDAAERGHAAPDDGAAERGQAAPGDDAAGRGGPADGDAAPRWTIRPQAGPGSEATQEDETAAAAGEAHQAAETAAAKPAQASEAAGATQLAEPVKADAPAAAEPAGAAESGPASQPDDAGQPEPEPDAKTETAKTEASGAAEKPAKAAKPAGPVQVTVVPGVARYHRAECILIRFLGDDDLETMPKQQAVSDGLIACRACQPDELPDS